MKRGKRINELRARMGDEELTLREALSLCKELSNENFDASVEVAMRLGVNPRKAEENLRGSCPAPAGLGKKITVLAFVSGDKIAEARDAGADIIGDDEVVEKIQQGWTEFDKVVATPDQMKSIARLGRILGPKKLMPSPKDGTVTPDIGKAVSELKQGKINFRVDRAGIVHAMVGKVSFDLEALYKNAHSLIDTLVKMRPASVKGRYIKSITISSTMGPGIKVNPRFFADEARKV
ncbi:MAG: 50S ribosomal protein L1 [Candidatus Coatesbacteria bacterium]|nr:50S ribosomal protein L1 [Candidatus Coatesbacteria bacterium]